MWLLRLIRKTGRPYNSFSCIIRVSAATLNENFASLKTAIESIPPWTSDTTTQPGNTIATYEDRVHIRQDGGAFSFQPKTPGATFDIDWFDATDSITGAFRWNLTYRGSAGSHQLQLQNPGGAQTVNFNPNGYVGLMGQFPGFPLHLASGAHVTTGGAWTNASSREYKDSIQDLESRQARVAFDRLRPVSFVYKKEPGRRHLGFIAEDVPDLVATKDRKGLAAMDLVALLVRVNQDQQRELERLRERVDRLERVNQR